MKKVKNISSLEEELFSENPNWKQYLLWKARKHPKFDYCKIEVIQSKNDDEIDKAGGFYGWFLYYGAQVIYSS